jgi:hypothetical protein
MSVSGSSYVSVCAPVPFCLFPCLCPFVSLSLFACVPGHARLCPCSFRLCPYPCPCPSLFCPCPCPFLFLSLPLSACVQAYLSLSVCDHVPLPVSLCPSPCQSVSFSMSFCISVLVNGHVWILPCLFQWTSLAMFICFQKYQLITFQVTFLPRTTVSAYNPKKAVNG